MEHEPTSHGPGSEEKMQVLSDRYEAGLPLWHPDDATMCSREPGYQAKPGERGRHVSTEPGVTIREESCE